MERKPSGRVLGVTPGPFDLSAKTTPGYLLPRALGLSKIRYQAGVGPNKRVGMCPFSNLKALLPCAGHTSELAVTQCSLPKPHISFGAWNHDLSTGRHSHLASPAGAASFKNWFHGSVCSASYLPGRLSDFAEADQTITKSLCWLTDSRSQ